MKKFALKYFPFAYLGLCFINVYQQNTETAAAWFLAFIYSIASIKDDE